MGNRDEVIIDADFFISTTLLDEGEFFFSIMDEFEVSPIMHQYVAEVELEENQLAQKLISEGKIRKVTYAEFLPTDFEKTIYSNDVWELYEVENESELPQERYRDIYNPEFRMRKHHLGEIMSELMARELRLPLFMSNDKGAKRLAKRHINNSRYKLEVRNLFDILKEIGQRENKLVWKTIKRNLNQTYFKDKKKELFPLWNEK